MRILSDLKFRKLKSMDGTTFYYQRKCLTEPKKNKKNKRKNKKKKEKNKKRNREKNKKNKRKNKKRNREKLGITSTCG